MSSSPSAVRKLWYRWKALRLPWRRQWLAGECTIWIKRDDSDTVQGADLAGNTFWEFKDAMNSNRFRRIVRYNPRAQYADVKISRMADNGSVLQVTTNGCVTAQWHQWLRHTRWEAPSIQEQQYDVSRQAQMKQLAQQADERWNSVPSFLDSPERQQPAPAIGVKDPGGYVQQTEPEQSEGVRSAVEGPEKVADASEGRPQDEGRFRGATKEKQAKENPWHKQQGGPSEGWQPQSWTPGAVSRR